MSFGPLAWCVLYDFLGQEVRNFGGRNKQKQLFTQPGMLVLIKLYICYPESFANLSGLRVSVNVSNRIGVFAIIVSFAVRGVLCSSAFRSLSSLGLVRAI